MSRWPRSAVALPSFRWQWNACSLAAFALSVAALVTPFFSTHNCEVLGFALHRGFSLVCHQRPERSFWLFGAPFAVCARCLGTYVGAAFGFLLRTSRTIALRLFVAAIAINALDAASELAGLHGNWMAVRFWLGVLLGATAALLIASSSSLTAAASGSSA